MAGAQYLKWNEFAAAMNETYRTSHSSDSMIVHIDIIYIFVSDFSNMLVTFGDIFASLLLHKDYRS